MADVESSLPDPSSPPARRGDTADGRDGTGPDHDHDHMVHEHDHMVHEHRDVQGGAARAAVFGMSDGLVSNVALILFVAAASAESSAVLTAGVAGLLAGAISMAAGEYGSVKAQAELVERELDIERISLAEEPELETQELASIYRSRGINAEQAEQMATAVMADPDIALEVHAREELGVDPDEVGNPLAAAGSSFVSFAIGAVLPLIPWFIAEGAAAMIASAVIGVVAAAAVGLILARFTKRSAVRSAMRYVLLAAGACLLTWLIGSLFGAAV